MAKLVDIIEKTGYSVDQFMQMNNIAFISQPLTVQMEATLTALATCIITISNLSLVNEQYKEEVEAINLRLDLANVPRESESAEIIQIQNGKNIRERGNDDNR